MAWPPSAPLLIIPVVLSALIVRLRTVADDDGVTARTLLGSQTVAWDDIDGLRFNRGSWARAQLKNGRAAAIAGGDLRDPAATDRSQRRTGPQPVPVTSVQRIHAVEQHPYAHTGGDADDQRHS